MVVVSAGYAQISVGNRSFSIIDYKAGEKKGEWTETIHYRYSVYFSNSNQLKLTGEYIITRKNWVKTDSIPINSWKYWNVDGELICEEKYDKSAV